MNNFPSKIVLDSVHGTVELESPLVRIIDTPEFQRMRNIKQLESITFVYPCAQHSRFEHSIGTAHLAGLLIETLRKKQPEMNIDDKDVLCVKIAALCHDLGHGPFSHLFEKLMKRIYLEKNPNNNGKNFFEHEQASVAIFDRIFEKVKNYTDFKQTRLNEKDKEFIKELISPKIVKDIYKLYEKLKVLDNQHNECEPLQKKLKSNDSNDQKTDIKRQIERLNNQMIEKLGRSKDKAFLFEIVSNFRNSIDVDKWDYFARDALNLGIHTTFDHIRFIHNCRIINPDKTLNQICVRDNELRNVYEMFRTREDLYKRAYMHDKGVGIKEMIIDALFQLNEVVGFYEIVTNLERNLDKYLDLDDRIIYINSILLTDDQKKKLNKTKVIVDRLLNRKLYKLIKKNIIIGNRTTVEKAQLELVEKMQHQITKADFTIVELKINYGNGNRDPLEKLQFFEKKTFAIIDKSNITEYNSQMKPRTFEEITWNLYLKNLDLDKKTIDALKNCFDQICNSNQ